MRDRHTVTCLSFFIGGFKSRAMVKHALSQEAKKHQSHQEADQTMMAAIEACCSEIRKPEEDGEETSSGDDGGEL